MKSFAAFVHRIANLKTLAVATLLYLTFPAYFLKNAETRINQLSGKPVGVIDLTITYDTERTRQLLGAYSPEARSYYARTEATIDVAYPLVYAFFFAIILAMLFRNARFGIPTWVVVLPFIAQWFDYAENFFIYKLLTNYPDVPREGLLVGCETAKLLKWSLFLVIMGLIVYGLVRRIAAKIQG